MSGSLPMNTSLKTREDSDLR